MKPKICYNMLQYNVFFVTITRFPEEKHTAKTKKTKGSCRLDYHIHRIIATEFSYFCFRIYWFKVTGVEKYFSSLSSNVSLSLQNPLYIWLTSVHHRTYSYNKLGGNRAIIYNLYVINKATRK